MCIDHIGQGQSNGAGTLTNKKEVLEKSIFKLD